MSTRVEPSPDTFAGAVRMRSPSPLVAAAACIVAAMTVLGSAAHAETLPAVVALIDEQTQADDTFSEPSSLPRGRASSSTDHQLRLELGVGGPGGLMAVRYSRVLATGTRIEPAFGLGYTGVVGSLLVTQPLVDKVSHTRAGTPYVATFEIYGGYSASHLRDGLHHPWVGRESFIPDGTYHWIDLGLSTQMRWRGLVLTAGLGATKLVSGPNGIGGENLDEETFWWVFPEGWIGKQRMAPSLWSSIGHAF